MASLDSKVECRLAAHARCLLIIAAVMARVGFKLPHPLVLAICNRSWSMRIGNGNWRRIRIDNSGRIIR